MKYTLTIHDRSVTLSCSDGRSLAFAITSRHDYRIYAALGWCRKAGYDIEIIQQ